MKAWQQNLNTQAPLDINPLVHLWMLRLLVPLGGHRQFINPDCFRDDVIAEKIGLGYWLETVEKKFEPKLVRAELRKLHHFGERKYSRASPPALLSKNIKKLSNLVGLSEIDGRILEFAVLIQSERILDDTADLIGALSSIRVFQTLAVLLDLPEKDIRSSLSGEGILARSGLVSLSRNGVLALGSRLDLLSEAFADIISSSESDPVKLLRDIVSIASPPELKICNYEHISSSLSILRPYLKHSIRTSRKGVNILIYGDPGTGKSQLAKVLALELECELFEVASEDSDGDPVNGERRLRAFRAAQSFFAHRKVMILFDEVEDIFNDSDNFSGRKSTAQLRKAWINRVLEDNPAPTIWLSNSISGVDPAFMRRFDMVFELPIPPKCYLEQILLENCANFLDSYSVARIAASEALAPALITKAVSVISSIQDELGPEATGKAFELLIDNTLQAQGHKSIEKKDSGRLPDFYDPHFINADSDLSLVAAGLLKSKSGRLCLYGPPGTGKTAYGRWLAEQMGVPLIVKRASDLISKYVGENEQNIAIAFRHAERDGALLLIDEVDTFLQDRMGANRGWEVSLVNEMLTQMESFSGVFIASTNLMKGLDKAALRRFDLKVNFGYLQPNQACELFRKYCAKLLIDMPTSSQMTKIMRMRNLTPGDFAAVFRQNLFRQITSTEHLVSALESECGFKDEKNTYMGFLH